MNIFEYVKKFAKSVGKPNILDEVSTTRDELVNYTLPLFAKNLEWLRRNDRDLTSQAYQRDRDELIKDFSRSGYLRPSNPFEMIYKSLNNSLSILDYLEGFFNKSLEADVTAASITISKSNAFQLLDLIAFASKYTRAWLDLILSAESNTRNQLAGELSLTQGQIKYLGENRDAYGRAISILATPVKEIEVIFAAFPEIVISEANARAVSATQAAGKVDPFRFNLIQSRWDPSYLIGMIVTDYQVYRYKLAREEKEAIELRVLRLKKQLENKNDPSLAKIIEKREEQLDKLRGKIRAMEDDIK